MEHNLFDKTCKVFTTLLTDDEIESIFYSHNRLINNSSQGIVSDEDHPDIKRYYFSTMGNDIVALGRNNIPICVRTKTTLNNCLINNEVLNLLDKKYEPSKIHKGVYIIDYICYQNELRVPFENILNHFLNLPKNIDQNLARRIAEDISKKRVGRQQLRNYTIKLIHFVSGEDIVRNGHIYIPNLDICLSKSCVDGETTHPFSGGNFDRSELSRMQNNLDPDSTKIILEIIDNDKMEPYYINIGNEVHKIYSTKNINKHNNIKFLLQKNGSIYKDMFLDLTDHKSVGLYKTEEEASVAGNIDKKLELERLKLETRKMELDIEKLNTDKMKLTHAVEVLNIELAHMKEKHSMDMIKRNVDLNHSVIKNTIDLSYLRVKEELNFKSVLIKNFGDIKQSQLKEETEKLNIEGKKIDNGLKLINLATTILKIIF